MPSDMSTFNNLPLISKEGFQSKLEEEMRESGSTILGFCFSAQVMIPTHKQAIERLRVAYNSYLKEKGLEIIYISCDVDLNSYERGKRNHPWCSLPFECEQSVKLREKYCIQNLPSLVLIDYQSNELITTEGINCIIHDHLCEYFPWYPFLTIRHLCESIEVVKSNEVLSLPSLLKQSDVKYLLIYFSTDQENHQDDAILHDFYSNHHENLSFEILQIRSSENPCAYVSSRDWSLFVPSYAFGYDIRKELGRILGIYEESAKLVILSTARWCEEFENESDEDFPIICLDALPFLLNGKESIQNLSLKFPFNQYQQPVQILSEFMFDYVVRNVADKEIYVLFIKSGQYDEEEYSNQLLAEEEWFDSENSFILFCSFLQCAFSRQLYDCCSGVGKALNHTNNVVFLVRLDMKQGILYESPLTDLWEVNAQTIFDFHLKCKNGEILPKEFLLMDIHSPPPPPPIPLHDILPSICKTKQEHQFAVQVGEISYLRFCEKCGEKSYATSYRCVKCEYQECQNCHENICLLFMDERRKRLEYEKYQTNFLFNNKPKMMGCGCSIS